MKKILAVLLALLVLVSVVACGETAETTAETAAETTAAEVETTGSFEENTTENVETTAEKVETTAENVETTTEKVETTAEKSEETTAAPEGKKELVTATIECCADSYTEQDSEKIMQVADAEKRVRVKAADGSFNRVAYFSFDTAAYAGKACEKAVFTFRLKYASNKPEQLEGRDVNLYAVEGAWDEATLSGVHHPALGEKLVDVDDAILIDEAWVELDITEYVNAHLGEVISIALANDGNKATAENHLDIYSRETVTDVEKLILG